MTLKHAVLALALVPLACWSASAQIVVFGTRDGGQIAGLTFSRGDLIRYDAVKDTASIFLSDTVFTEDNDGTGIVDLDALHVQDDGNIIFSTRRPAVFSGTQRIPRDILNYDPVTGTTTRDFQFANNISGLHILPNGNLLLAVRVSSVIGGQEYVIGDIVEYNPATDVGSTLFSSSIFLTAEEGGNFTAPANIDALELLPNGNLLLSTTNTAEIGSSAADAVRLDQAGVYEYDFATGSVSTFLDPSIFQSTSTDIKALSVLSFSTVSGDFDGDGDVDVDDIDFYAGQLGQAALGALAQLDLDDDGFVTLADHDLHVTTLIETSEGQLGTAVGDINLDGTVDVLVDAATIIANLGAIENVGYATGDLNADQVIDVLGDAARLVSNLGQDNRESFSPLTIAVPEPSTFSLGIAALVFASLGYARERKA